MMTVDKSICSDIQRDSIWSGMERYATVYVWVIVCFDYAMTAKDNVDWAEDNMDSL